MAGWRVVAENKLHKEGRHLPCAYVVVNFLSQVIFVFLLFLGMEMYVNEVESKEKQKLPEIKKLTTTHISLALFVDSYILSKKQAGVYYPGGGGGGKLSCKSDRDARRLAYGCKLQILVSGRLFGMESYYI